MSRLDAMLAVESEIRADKDLPSSCFNIVQIIGAKIKKGIKVLLK